MARRDPTRKGVSVYITNPRGPNHEQELVIEEPYGSLLFNGGQGALVAADGLELSSLSPPLRRDRLTFDSVSVTMTDTGANGSHGALKLLDLPAGLIEVVGCLVNLTTVKVGAGIEDDAALVGSVGTATVGTDNDTLLGTEADIHPSIDGTLVAGEGELIGKTLSGLLTDSSGGTPGTTLAALPVLTDTPASADALRDDLNTNVWPVLKDWAASLAAVINSNTRRLFDGTTTAKDVYLNLAIPSAGATDDAEVLVTGTIDLLWINHGDL